VAWSIHETLPVRPAELVIGKFLAAWVVAGLALLLTFPIVTVVNLLGSADNRVIASQFLASWLLSGSLSLSGCFYLRTDPPAPGHFSY